MDESGSPKLEVGLEIAFGDSLADLLQWNNVVDEATANAIREFTAVKRATHGIVDMSPAIVHMKAFGNATSRTEQDVRVALTAASSSVGTLTRSLERQIEAAGKTSSEIRNLRVEKQALALEEAARAAKSKGDVDGYLAKAVRVRELNAELNALESRSVTASGGLGNLGKSSGQMRSAMQGASYQVQDLITQISMGANPINALAVQGGQLAGQFSNVEGKAGAVARFFMSGWGLGITAGLMVLAPLVSKLFEQNDALDDAVDKLKKNARETESTGQAKEVFSRSLEGVTAALNENENALKRLEDADKSAARRALESAIIQEERLVTIKRTTAALLEQAEAEMRAAMQVSFGAGGGAGAYGAQKIFAEQVADLQKRAAEATAEADRAQDQTIRSLGVRLAELSSLRLDPMNGIKSEYDAQIKLAGEQATVEEVMNGSLARRYDLINANRRAAEETERASQAAARRTGTPGVTTFRSREDAIGIAGKELQSAGMRVDGNVQFGYTSGHKNDVDHNKYAIDVNVGKGVTEANIPDLKKRYDEIARLYQSRGFEVVWNKQFYAAGGNGPTGGAAGHTNHLHIKAPGTIVGKATQASSAKQALSEQQKFLADQQRQYEATVAAAKNYAAAQVDQAAKVGLGAQALRLYADAAAIAKAPTEALKQAIRDGAKEREAALGKQSAANFEANVLRPMRDELALHGLVGPARAAAALALEKEGFIAQHTLSDGLEVATQRWNEYHAAKKNLIDKDSAADREAESVKRLIDGLALVADQASATANAMSSAFGNVGDVIGGLVANLADYRVAQAELSAWAGTDAKKQEIAGKKLATLEARNVAQALSGAKSLFKEKSTGYKIMQGIEMAYAAWQTINTVRSIALDTSKTASSVANSGARAAADGVAAVAKAIASLPFPLNLAAGAATAAALVAFGVKMFGGGGGSSGPSMPNAEDIQAGAGTGSILGDSKAKSESIARSLEIVASNTNRDLEYSSQMLRSLRSIDTSISKMAGTVAQQIQVSGSMFDTSRLKLGTSGSGGFLGIGAKSTTRTLSDLGMTLGSGSVADIIANGISGSSYQIVEKIKKSGFLGIGGGTKTSYSTTSGAIDPSITGAVQDVVMALRNGIVSAADVIGLPGAQAIVDSLQINIGRISFKDMTGEQIESQLNAIFSKLGDDMAGSVLPALTSMQLVGEGLFETFMRVAREYQVVDVALESIGTQFGAVGVSSVAARDALVQLFGSLDEFVERTSFFRDEFLSEAEQIAPVIAAVREEMTNLGLAGITTREQFKQAVLGLELTTEAGRKMYASLLSVAPAFDKVLDYYEKANKTVADGLSKTVEQFTSFAESLKKYRDALFTTEAVQGNAYALLRGRFIQTASLAAAGNATALGGLEGAGKAFLDTARNNASTREQYLRDVALVAQGVDKGIFAAESTADYAQLQLDAAQNAVTVLTAISANTAATAAALGAAPSSSATVAAAGANHAASMPAADTGSSDELRAELAALRAELAGFRADSNAGHAATAGNTARMARKLDDVTAASGGDAISMAVTR